jgi:hypothetical protein
VLKKYLILIFIYFLGQLAFGQQTGFQDSIKLKVAPILHQKKSTHFKIIASNPAQFMAWLQANIPDARVKVMHQRVLSVQLKNKADFKKLEKSPWVKFIDQGNRKAVEESILGDFDFTVNTIRSVHSLQPALSGVGLATSIKEKPFDQNDLDLVGRVILTNQFDELPSLHATFMATIAAGAGNTTPYAKGAAWGAHITTSDFDQLSPDDGEALTNLGISVQNHSYGVNDIENYYGIESYEYDQSCIDFPKILHVFSSGNRGTETSTTGTYTGVTAVANLTGQFKVSKNTIAVGSSDRHGNIVSFSSRGPAHDGRIKPELIALGDAGSSDAAAIVSGIGLLVQHAYKNIHNELPDAALVKAALITSAIDTGRPNVDFETGFGNTNALGAIRIIENETYFTESIAQDGEVKFEVAVPSNIHLLKVTLVWNDPPADPFAEKALVNDLDIILRHVSSGEEWNPWILNSSPSVAALKENAVRGVDRLNNVEQITLSLPSAGDYEIVIKGFNITQGPQKFFVAYDFLSGFEWTYPLQNDALKSNNVEILRWHWNKPAAMGALEYRFASEDEWQLINSNIDLTQSWYEWTTPDTAALVELRLTVGLESFESLTFSISKPNRVQVGFNCDEEVMLHWSKVKAAQEYILYSLADQYLEPFLITTDTFAVVQKNQLSSNYFSVSPAFTTGKEGLRESTVNYSTQGTGCYFISFLPENYLVTDVANFNVQLGTTYNLQSATLERLRNNAFEKVSALSPVPETNFTLTDPAPLPGTQTYRVKLTTIPQAVIYSASEEIIYVRENDLFIYPNPVHEGEFLNIVVNNEEEAILELYDIHGRMIRKTTDFGPVKEMMMLALPKGTYHLKVRKSDGTTWVRRISVL